MRRRHGRAFGILLAPELATAEEARNFSAACELATALDHPHVVAVLDRGDARRVPYLVVEHARCGTLADWIAANGPLPVRAATLAAVQLVDAMTGVHGLGAVHRLADGSARSFRSEQTAPRR